MTDTKLKEWTIFRKTHFSKSDCRIAGPDCEFTHVTEHSAYLAVVWERDDAREANSKAFDELIRLRHERDKLRAALEDIRTISTNFDGYERILLIANGALK